jgi:hypothetical protein
MKTDPNGGLIQIATLIYEHLGKKSRKKRRGKQGVRKKGRRGEEKPET